MHPAPCQKEFLSSFSTSPLGKPLLLLQELMQFYPTCLYSLDPSWSPLPRQSLCLVSFQEAVLPLLQLFLPLLPFKPLQAWSCVFFCPPSLFLPKRNSCHLLLLGVYTISPAHPTVPNFLSQLCYLSPEHCS